MPTFSGVVVGYVPVTLTNSQSSATSANLPVKITVNSSTYSVHEASDVSNINWQDGAGNILKSWCESGDSSGSSSTVYYVNLGSNTISGSSGTITIYLCFYATGSSQLNNTTTGKYPTATGTYGQYDDGAAVFGTYTNFAGTSVPSGWNTNAQGATVTYNNGVTITQGTLANGGPKTTATFNPGIICDALCNYETPTVNNAESGFSDNVSNACLIGIFTATPAVLNYNAGVNNSATFSSIQGGANHIYTIYWPTSGSSAGYIDYVLQASNATIFPTLTNTLFLEVVCLGDNPSGSSILFCQWVRTRIPPPANVMPSASLRIIHSYLQPKPEPRERKSWNCNHAERFGLCGQHTLHNLLEHFGHQL